MLRYGKCVEGMHVINTIWSGAHAVKYIRGQHEQSSMRNHDMYRVFHDIAASLGFQIELTILSISVYIASKCFDLM